MYEAPGSRSLGCRGCLCWRLVSAVGSWGQLGKCSSVQKMLYQRKVKWVMSLCAGILLCCIMLFSLIVQDPTKVAEEPLRLSGRGLRMVSSNRHWLNHALIEQETRRRDQLDGDVHEAALEGMGMVFRRGTRDMPQLVVAHLLESTTRDDLRLFLRGLHRSGMPSLADIVLLFPFEQVATDLAAVIREEEQYFQKLLAKDVHVKGGHAGGRKLMAIADGLVHSPKLSPFNSAAYTHAPSAGEFTIGPSIWAQQQQHRNDTKKTNSEEDEAALSYGAMVGFGVQELDPDDALSGFLDSPSIHLRRWICYQILLGMVRQRYRHVLLTEVTGVVILKDILAPFKKKESSLHLYHTGQRWSDAESIDLDSNSNDNVIEAVYGRSFWGRLEEEDKSMKVISAGIIYGGIRPVGSMATAMATEIVRVAMLRKSREPFRVDALLSYLVHKSSVLGKKVTSHLQVHESGVSDVNLLPGPRRGRSFDDLFRKRGNQFAVIQGLKNSGTSATRRKKILDSLKKDICQSQNDLGIYSDCFRLPEAVIEIMIQY